MVITGITDEKQETVQKLVKQRGKKMKYLVAIDEDNRTAVAYMKALGLKLCLLCYV